MLVQEPLASHCLDVVPCVQWWVYTPGVHGAVENAGRRGRPAGAALRTFPPPGPLGNMMLAGTSAGALTVHHSQVQGVSLRSLYKRSSGQVTFTMDPVRDLLIWAIVQNRRELAEIIWAQVTRPVAVSGPVTGLLQPGAWPGGPALTAGGVARAGEGGQWACHNT